MVKIISGYSEKGGSTTAFINLTNIFNENGIDCVFYGPHQWHLDKCKSGTFNDLKYNDYKQTLMDLRLRRDKPIIQKKNTLEEYMSLTIK